VTSQIADAVKLFADTSGGHSMAFFFTFGGIDEKVSLKQ
jgi:hypothetical protein